MLYVQLITRIYELWTFSGVGNCTEKRDFSVSSRYKNISLLASWEIQQLCWCPVGAGAVGRLP